MLRLLPIIAVLLLGSRTFGQCACAEVYLLIRTPGPAFSDGTWNYDVQMTGARNYHGSETRNRWRMDTVAGVPDQLLLELSTGAGVRSMTWIIRDKRSGTVMEVDLANAGGDSHYPDVCLSFQAGAFAFDFTKLRSCVVAVHGLWPPDTVAPDAPPDTIPCNDGHMQWSNTGGWGVIEPLDGFRRTP